MDLVDQQTLTYIRQGFHIPAMPEALTTIQALQAEGDYDLIKAGDAVASDVELSGLIIKTINSSFFGLSNKIANIHQAAVMLGFQNIFQIVTACCLQKAFISSNEKTAVQLERFWNESIETAMCCQKLAMFSNAQVKVFDAYALGLFYNCGVAAMLLKFDDYAETWQMTDSACAKNLQLIEQKNYGVNHAAVGYVIAHSWNVPDDLCRIIQTHHERDLLQQLRTEYQQLLAAILLISRNAICNKFHQRDLSDWGESKLSTFDTLKLTEAHFREHFQLD